MSQPFIGREPAAKIRAMKRSCLLFLRKIRKGRKISQLTICKAIGSNKATICNIETNQKREPSWELISEYADYLGYELRVELVKKQDAECSDSIPKQQD